MTATVPGPASSRNPVTPPARRTAFVNSSDTTSSNRIKGTPTLRRDSRQQPAGHVSGVLRHPETAVVVEEPADPFGRDDRIIQEA
ncbi:hypothetical protein ACIRG4_04705 [Streptomyces sp. NPDC102395]|uniref:hypothetical protein n=1 Tax=Streptomyces sp. NPDC102395 TaxID=3366168 RepID=UPI00380C0DB6